MSEKLEIQHHADAGGVVHLQLAGALSADTVEVLEAEFRVCLERGETTLVLHLDGLAELTVVGACGLVGLISMVHERHGTVQLVEPREALFAAFEDMELVQLLPWVAAT